MTTRLFVVAPIVSLLIASSVLAQTKPRTHARLIWQDGASQTLQWGDVKQQGETWSLESKPVTGMPKMDPERQSFGQIQSIDTLALVAVRDDDDGNYQSGWIALSSGVEKEAHGDHFHWHFSGAPQVLASRLNDKQGNPAHVYTYNGAFYLANDKKNGFTQVQPQQLRAPGTQADQFFEAGGGHITLAVAQGRVAYSTWIDREGDNMGRVDVVGLGSNGGRRYRFQLPTGGIHGATANSGKIFLAPSDGVCWVQADTSVSKQGDAVDVHYLSLGEAEDGTPLRTGAFTNAGNSVLCVVAASTPKLCLMDAAAAKPRVSEIEFLIADGNRLSKPTLVRSRTGSQFALLFEESAAGEQAEKLHVVALDPNRDGNFADAKLHESLAIGKSLIEGHSGHHEAVALSKRVVAISNPGDGTISLISTSDWKTQATLKVDGDPTRMVAIGGM